MRCLFTESVLPREIHTQKLGSLAEHLKEALLVPHLSYTRIYLLLDSHYI
jgi:hypothetical protein